MCEQLGNSTEQITNKPYEQLVAPTKTMQQLYLQPRRTHPTNHTEQLIHSLHWSKQKQLMRAWQPHVSPTRSSIRGSEPIDDGSEDPHPYYYSMP